MAWRGGNSLVTDKLAHIFELPEYDYAFTRFLYTTANELARAQHPVLGEMRTETAEGGASSVVDSRDSEQLDLSSEPVGFEIRWDRDDLLSGRSDALLLQLDSAGNELGGKMVEQFVKTIGAVTESTGNKVNAEGKKFSF